MPPDSSPPIRIFLFHHQVGNIFKADGALNEFTAMRRRDPVNHLRGIECADHRSRPVAALEKPAQQNANDLVRVHEGAVLVDGTDAVSVSIRRQARIAFSRTTVSCSRATWGRMGSGLIPGKSGFTSWRMAVKGTPASLKILARIPRPEPWHGINREPKPPRERCWPYPRTCKLRRCKGR